VTADISTTILRLAPAAALNARSIFAEPAMSRRPLSTTLTVSKEIAMTCISIDCSSLLKSGNLR
jgi:hypothetical protein